MKADTTVRTNELLLLANAPTTTSTTTTENAATAVVAAECPTTTTAPNSGHNAEQQHIHPPAPTTTMLETTATTTCFTTADRYGVVITTLLENKMLAIKQQSSGGAAATDHVSKAMAPGKQKRRSLVKTLTQCVRRDSIAAATQAANATALQQLSVAEPLVDDVDIELGQMLDDHDENAEASASAIEDADDADVGSVCFTDVDELELRSQNDQHHHQNGTSIGEPNITDVTTTHKDCQIELPAVASHSDHCHTLKTSPPVPDSSGASNLNTVSVAVTSHQRSEAAGVRPQHQQYLHHQRIMAARSISAQASPLLPRTQSHAGPSREPVNQSSNVTITENRFLDAQEPVQLQLHQQQPIAPTLDTSVYRFAQSLSQSLAAVKSRHDRSTTTTPRPVTGAGSGTSVESEASSSHGFINNFNELTAHSLSNAVYVNRPVMTSATVTSTTATASGEYHRREQCRPGWPTRPSSFDRRSADRYSPDGMATVSTTATKTAGGDWDYHFAERGAKHSRRTKALLALECGAGGGGEDVDRLVESKWTSRRKYRHRGSDPVLIYPSSSGLPQCLLSMPPNRSIQIKYDDNTLYDVSLELDRKHTKKDAAARKSGHSRHHHQHEHHRQHHQHGNNSHHHNRHHRHHTHHDDPEGGRRHHGRRHKKRILVHDLDTQKVKVIDPDDLPQRARWTIIATACLLLIMCLLLVGVTLRMAPLIDDMVRQENERLQQESLNRARFVRNITDAATAAAAAAVATLNDVDRDLPVIP